LGGKLNGEDERTGLNKGEYWCGVCGKTAVYIKTMVAPYGKMLVGYSSRICPFSYRRSTCTFCKYPSMHAGEEDIWPNGCPKDCDNCTDEFLMERNREYEKRKGR